MELTRKKVAISGGSSGIGLAAAKLLAARGCDVALLARGAERLESARAEVAAVPGAGTVIAVSVDVTDDASVAVGAAAVIEGLGGLDVVIANQGYARCATVLDAPIDAYREILDTNYLGHVRLVKAFAPHLVAQKQGAICLVTSMLGFMSFYGYSAYSGSKFAIAGFAEAVRQELLPHGVELTVFYPPTTDTPGLEAENQDKPALTWAIEGSSTQYTSEQVATVMLQGVETRRFVNMVGAEAWFIYRASRWAPWLVRWILDSALWKHVKQKGLAG
ncbi:MAG: SDR family NAD(P)-dependent oxidoreductase [Alphaproteobacteria bacterium]|nr:SDR family NAD(P)-dependent oxidoreductase [Alphaproteobacteria bacterium]